MKFLVYDFNLFIEHAKRLAADGKNQVFYYSPWQDSFPAFSKYAVGLGVPGVEKVLYFFDYVDEADCIVFFDVYANDLADWLRKKGYTVFGAGKGELLENHRWLLKQIVKKAGLPLHNAVKIKGLIALREYLKTHPNKYVKIDIFRKDVDSFHAKNYESVKLLLDELDVVYGPIKDQFNFIVEDAIKADESVEPGIDGFFQGEKFVEPLLLGFEIQKASYLGKFVRFKELPVQLRKILEGLQPVLRKLDYRGAFSIEAKVVSTRTAYLLDICSRLFAPASAGYVEWIKNFDELVYKVAKKEDVEIVSSAPYVGCLPLESFHANQYWVMVDFDKKLEKYFKMRQYCQVADKYYAVPGLTGVVNIIADGNSVKEVYNKIKKLVDEVDAYGLQTDVLGGLEIAQKEIEKAKSFGIDF